MQKSGGYSFSICRMPTTRPPSASCTAVRRGCPLGSDAEYASSFPQGYIDAVAAAMPNSQTSVVQRAGWSEFALRIVDVIQEIYGGADPSEAAAAAQSDFRKLVAN